MSAALIKLTTHSPPHIDVGKFACPDRTHSHSYPNGNRNYSRYPKNNRFTKILVDTCKQAVRNMSLRKTERLQAHGVNLNNLRNDKIVVIVDIIKSCAWVKY